MSNDTSINDWDSPDYFRLFINGGSGNNNLTPTDETTNFDLENITDNEINKKIGVGSNFMLLLEDFGEYFYNYNGSGQQNLSHLEDFDFKTNCSAGNSTDCNNPLAGMYFLFYFVCFFFFLMGKNKKLLAHVSGW